MSGMIFGLLLCATPLAWAANEDVPASTKDLAYKKAGPRNVLDIYYPKTGAAPRPAVIYIHGGGWTGGSKGLRNASVKALFQSLSAAGFVGISVDYRVRNTEQNIFIRESSIDAMDAVRFVFKNADTLGIDRNNIFLWGTSAGAHLALLCAGAQPDQLTGDPELKGVPTPIKGVLAWYPPTDMINYEEISVTKFSTDLVAGKSEAPAQP